MTGPFTRILLHLFEISMVGLALVCSLLFVAALLGSAGYMPEGSSLQMMGRTVQTDAEYHAFMVSNAAFGVLGWIYVYLRFSGRLRIVIQPKSSQK